MHIRVYLPTAQNYQLKKIHEFLEKLSTADFGDVK